MTDDVTITSREETRQLFDVAWQTEHKTVTVG